MNSISIKVAAATALLMLGGTSLAFANSITVGGGTTGSGPYDLVSNSTTPYSYVQVDLTSGIAFSSITGLSAGFSDLSGGAEVGSPRIVLEASNGDSFWVYLGTPPNFNNDVAGLNAFSGVNLNNGTANTAFDNGNTYQSIASLQALYGPDIITSITIPLDGGYGPNGPQEIVVPSLNVNGTNLLAPVPEPVTLSLFGAGLAGAFVAKRRKAKKA